MMKFHKILFLGAAISCLAIMPGRESSAQETPVLPDGFISEAADESMLEIYEDDSFALNPNELPSMKGDGFCEDVSFAKYEKNILQDDTHTLEIQNLKDGCDVSFKSSNTDVLTVEQLSNTSCSYKGVGYGTAKINVTITKTTAFFFKEKKTIRATVSVTPKAVSVMFRHSERKVALDGKATLSLTLRPSISKELPVFESMNKKIVTITKKGKITGKKLGSTYITATLLNGKSAKCKVTVVKKLDDNDIVDDDKDNKDDTEE